MKKIWLLSKQKETKWLQTSSLQETAPAKLQTLLEQS